MTFPPDMEQVSLWWSWNLSCLGGGDGSWGSWYQRHFLLRQYCQRAGGLHSHRVLETIESHAECGMTYAVCLLLQVGKVWALIGPLHILLLEMLKLLLARITVVIPSTSV